MKLTDFKKIFSPIKFPTSDDHKLCGTYRHKNLPIELSIHMRYKDRPVTPDDSYKYDYYWEINRYIVDELDYKTPEDISDEQLNLLLLKYSGI